MASLTWSPRAFEDRSPRVRACPALRTERAVSQRFFQESEECLFFAPRTFLVPSTFDPAEDVPAGTGNVEFQRAVLEGTISCYQSYVGLSIIRAPSSRWVAGGGCPPSPLIGLLRKFGDMI